MDSRTAGGNTHAHWRPIAAIGLLALSLGLAAVLAVQSIQTARRHRATTERALQDYADFAAFILATHVYRELGDAVTRTFAGWRPPNPPLVPAGTACPSGTTFFEEHDDGILRLGGAPLPPGVVAFLKDSLLQRGGALRLLEEASWRLRFVRAPYGPTDGFFILRRGGLVGFGVCFQDGVFPSRTPSLIRRIMLAERALPAALIGETPADSMFSVILTAGTGRPLYASPGARLSPYHGVAVVGADLFGDLSLRVDLRPELAGRLIVGGVPSSRAPLALGLLGLSAVLVLAALLQLRREYRLMAARSAFVANVSHELRTPLSQILIFTELLKLGKLRSDAERSRAFEIMDQETRRLIRLVENVLHFSRAGAVRPVTVESVPLETAVREALDAFRPLAAAREATLRAEISPGTRVRADRSGLRQILLNLLDNAVKYGPRGQVVTVQAESLDGRTRVAVADQGPGIPSGERERIWEAHYRLRRESGGTVAGSGLGLAVVRSLAESMRGSAWVEDARTGGARFVVDLPSDNGDPA